MREIDPQSDGPMENDQLTQVLRQLASSSRQGAPAAVGMGLATAFRRHHRRRMLVRRISLAFVACIAIAAGLLSIRSPHQQPQKQQTDEVSGKVAEKPAKALSAASTAGTPTRPSAKRVTPKAAPLVASSVRREFLALPGYDPGVPAEQLSVVRVQLPASALWQMGAPVSPDSGARKFMADFVVAQDGTPYAVRLVQ
ncbi:MAG: hypothetical protein JWN42_2628 [Candidatus Angelobacter sp.]|nr:hypothetical protein [Candidatus Angelobacter sp.]